ncbi:MAG TPA: oligosaccharide flippase family protein [Atribacter sp.]|uniref:oligosaccharide flippase family protein n=1 Tax=Atribacter sp. TaxID=2847780 RepID=UPI002C8B7F73|nr:oligosaccharide flippase family protein [Atribacter sp.]HQK83200.1 oligosaccharide flippase family protein [Atribacter sp.]
MQEYQLFAKRIGLIGITNILISLSGIVLLPILTKTLPIEEYGIYIQITVTIGLFPGVAMLGLPYTMVRYLAAAKSREEIQDAYYSIACITVISAGLASTVLFFLAEPIAAALFDGRTTILELLAPIIFLECMNLLQLNYFRTFLQIRKYSFFLFLKTGLQIILIVISILTGHGLLGVVMSFFVTSLILFLIMCFFIVHGIGITIPTFRNLREYLLFGLPTIPGNFSSWVVDSSDRYMIALFLGAAYVGYYSPGYTLGNILTMFISPLVFILPAILSKLYEENDLQAVQTILQYSLKYFLILAIPSSIGLSVLSKPILSILSTPEIASNGYLITPFTAMSAIFFGIYAIIVQILFLEKKTIITAKVWIVAALINFGLNLFAIPFFGIVGAAITTFCAFIFPLGVILYYTKKHSFIDIFHDFNKTILHIFLASLCVIPIIIMIKPSDITSLIVTIMLYSFLYFVFLFMLREIKEQEIQFFKKLIIAK